MLCAVESKQKIEEVEIVYAVCKSLRIDTVFRGSIFPDVTSFTWATSLKHIQLETKYKRRNYTDAQFDFNILNSNPVEYKKAALYSN